VLTFGVDEMRDPTLEIGAMLLEYPREADYDKERP
jgi:hypothetical protein